MKRIALALGLALLLAGGASAQAEHPHGHGFSGAEHWAKVFDDPARDEWQKPHEVIQALRLAPDATVADIGAGTGYFTARIAHMTPRGRIYAVDIEPDMVKYLSERAQREKLANVTAVLGKPNDPLLPEPVDRVLVVDTYHHIADRVAYFRSLKSRLKAGGEVAIVDFRRDSPIGPPVGMRVDPEDAKKEMADAGYALAAEHDFLPNQYFLVFRPRGR